MYAASGPAPLSGTPRIIKQAPALPGKIAGGVVAQEVPAAPKILADVAGTQADLWAFNFKENKYEKVSATCKIAAPITGSNYQLYIYVEDDSAARVTGTAINKIRDDFLNKVYPREKDFFGSPPDGDFTILVLDIKDNYMTTETTYLAGYFDPRNEFTVDFSNNRHMVYVDCDPGSPTSNTFLGVIAHEYAHFIHYGKDPYETAWVAEGLAGLAGFLCGYGHPLFHVNALAASPNASLVQWNDSQENYGAGYLFMLYLAEHYGGADITQRIVASTATGIDGINRALAANYPVTFNDVFKDWVVANYLNDASVAGGIYAYSGTFAGISPAGFSSPGTPGHFADTIQDTYPASGGGTVQPYAAQYVRFTNLTGTYNQFILVTYNLDTGTPQTYSYTGALGSLVLDITGLNGSLSAEGIQQGDTHPAVQIWALGENNTASTEGGVVTLTAGGNTGSSGSEAASAGGGGGCFIATAAFGSPMAREVNTLREFRNVYLAGSLAGRVFISFYNIVSPGAARLISRNENVRSAVRAALIPAVALSRLSLENPWVLDSVFFSFIAALTLAVYGVSRSRRGSCGGR